MKVKRALISVFNKAGLEEFARALADMGVEIISTGGTARLLSRPGHPRHRGLRCHPVPRDARRPGQDDAPAHPGRHPRQARRPRAHATIDEHGIQPIDMVVVSLYPFEEVAAQRGSPKSGHRDDRHRRPHHDPRGRQEPRERRGRHRARRLRPHPRRAQGERRRALRRHLPAPGHQGLPQDGPLRLRIANWFSETEGDFPSHILRDYEKVMELSYGENPHQRAAYYAESGARRHLLSRVTQLHGKKLSFNNLYDLHAARALASEFALPACVIIKHNNPCGSALAETLERAYVKALACDPVSAFGSVIAVNRTVDLATAQRMAELFVEVLFAPPTTTTPSSCSPARPTSVSWSTTSAARQPRRDGLQARAGRPAHAGPRRRPRGPRVMEVVSERHPTEAEWGDLIFAAGWPSTSSRTPS